MNGGQGGAGQEGGNGVTSNDGSQCIIPYSGEQCVDPNCNPRPDRQTAYTLFFNFGSSPLNGGNGGLGGIGGFGGYGGLAKITKLEDSLSEKNQIIVNAIGNRGNHGKDGKGGVGAIGGCRFKCTRTFHWVSERCCRESYLGVCVDYTSCTRKSEWINDLVNICDSRGQSGLTPTVKNSIAREPRNEIPRNTTSQLLIDYKIALS